MNDHGPAPSDSSIQRVREEYVRRSDRFDAHTPQQRRMFELLMSRVLRRYEQLFQRHQLLPLGNRAVLDVGSGRNEWLIACRERWGQTHPNLCGIDLMPDRVDRGVTEHPYLQLKCGSADQLPWPDRHFDLVHQGMLLSSILDQDLRMRIVAEMQRVTKPGGLILWYDFVWNPMNRAAKGIPWRAVRRYFANWQVVDRARVTLAPPLARRIAPWSEALLDAAESLRVLNFWQLALFRKPR